MANPAVRSFSTLEQSTGNPREFTKPAGLAEGDLLVLVVWSDGAYPSAGPSGFTQQDQTSTAIAQRSTLYTKVATATDVAASSFSVGNSSNVHLGGVIWAVSDPGDIEYHAGNQISGAASATVAGFTPAATGDLLLVASLATRTNLDPSTANNNPAWTVDVTTASWWSGKAAHGSYATGDTGAISGNWNASGSGSVVVIAVAPGGAPPAATPDLFLDGVWG